MPYATQANLIARFGEAELIQLTDRPDRADPENAGTIDSSVLNQAIADAEAEINGYLNRYTLPLPFIPPILTGIHCDFTRWRLYVFQMTDVVDERYKAGTKYLTLIATGKIDLFSSAGVEIDQNESSGVMLSEPDSTFGRDSFSAW